MKLVIDLQGAQASQKDRGVGRYSLALAKAMASAPRNHEVTVALSHSFPDELDQTRRTFEEFLPPGGVVLWQAPDPIRALDPVNEPRRRRAEILREAFLRGLKPDLVFVSNLFDGYMDEAVTSVKKYCFDQPTACTVYDLIPLVYEDQYLDDASYARWYREKVENLKQSNLLLAISDSVRREVVSRLDLPEVRVINISAAADPCFQPITIPESKQLAIRGAWGISRPFVMFTGGVDYRKNIQGLLRAYARLPMEVRKGHQLVIVCAANAASLSQLRKQASDAGLAQDEVVFTGFVSDEDLIALYNLCTVFCFPSLYEGFGIPALEAMQCGAATIGSDRSSIPEVIGCQQALFDPSDLEAFAAKLHQVLVDDEFRASLREHALKQARKFTWANCASLAWDGLEECHRSLGATYEQ